MALSDPSQTIASPLMTIQRTAEKKDHQRISDLVQEHSVGQVVVGLPRTLRGELGYQAQRVMRFGQRLEQLLDVPVVYWDERHSTADAERIVRNRGRGRGRPSRGSLDEVAAAVILQNYLDSISQGRSVAPPSIPEEENPEQ